jgi:hypothetical protein
MRGVALNLFPLEDQQCRVRVWQRPYTEGERPEENGEAAVHRRLPTPDGFESYWTFLHEVPAATSSEYELDEHPYLTLDALRDALLRACRLRLSAEEFAVVGGFRKRVEVRLDDWPEGRQVISLEPYLLRSRRVFGYLANFGFRPVEEHRRSKRALELSLSLDKAGQRNLNYYADRFERLQEFVRRYHERLFPLGLAGGHQVHVRRTLVEVETKTLPPKRYMVGAGREATSQFMGVKAAGPFEAAPLSAGLCFIYRAQDRPLSRDLFRALRGDTFRTFDGMESMFGFELTNDRVTGVALESFDRADVIRVRERVLSEAGGTSVVPIVLTPFSRHDEPEENAAYWTLKHAFLEAGMPIQVVASDTVARPNKLKWSVSGIGLQIFAKAGGTPWKVKPRNERCLIVGVGQAHHRTEVGIDRYLAYSVLTDSSGVFEEVRVLGEGRDEEQYLDELTASLRSIVRDYGDRFTSFVVHATFAIRRAELQRIEAVLREAQQQSQDDGEFVSLKFNDRNQYFGFAVDHNSRVPFESSTASLGEGHYLVWFEGLEQDKPTLTEMVAGPVHVQFNYPGRRLSIEHQRLHLQDAINLSGANWRGFSAKSLPVSVYYAQLIARYTKEFEVHGLPSVAVSTLRPWFL